MKPAALLVVLLAAGAVGAIVYVQVQKHGHAEAPGPRRPPPQRGEVPAAPDTKPAPPEEPVLAQITLLRGDDNNRAFQAAERLGTLGDPRAIAPLIATLEAHQDFYVRMGCVTALGALSAWAATPALVDALDDADELVREASADALHTITGHTIAPADTAPGTASARRALQDAWRAWLAGNGRGGK